MSSLFYILFLIYILLVLYITTAHIICDKINKMTQYKEHIMSEKLTTYIMFGNVFSFLFIEKIKKIRRQEYDWTRWKFLDKLCNMSKYGYSLLNEGDKRFYRNYNRKAKLEKLNK